MARKPQQPGTSKSMVEIADSDQLSTSTSKMTEDSISITIEEERTEEDESKEKEKEEERVKKIQEWEKKVDEREKRVNEKEKQVEKKIEELEKMMSEKEKIINEKVDCKKKQKQGKQDYNGEDDLIDCDICKKGVNGSECVQCDQCSGWYHVNCTMVKRIFKDLCEVEKNPNLIFGGALYFFCPPCEKAFKSNKDTKHVSNSKFEKESNVVVADRRLNEDEMTHPSLPTTTEVANRQLNEVERTHSSLPTSIASPSAEISANIADSNVSAAGPNVLETNGAGPHVSAVNQRNIQSTQSRFV